LGNIFGDSEGDDGGQAPYGGVERSGSVATRKAALAPAWRHRNGSMNSKRLLARHRQTGIAHRHSAYARRAASR
jgi:hypothetical protein